MVIQKYDISKSFKLSAQNIVSLSQIEQEKGFKSDSEAIRFLYKFHKSSDKRGTRLSNFKLTT
ncbi:hypothetical protein [Campylobacter mucosalis]|uniref:Uncharacterized protein n=1 Tax=Campylobacter mucosalis CCUG 21559 TaxID=1032067 RepID=A0A6G5QH00_9BACT|nr:hypothetical protein [Campylobacter mucosalis]QCD44931.1 hypothetical protein CMUC_1157 [Campylobacter mucosalis CCUG 21559]